MNTEQIPQEYSQLAEKIITESPRRLVGGLDRSEATCPLGRTPNGVGVSQLSSNVMELMAATGANNFRYMTAQHIKDFNAFLRSEESKKTEPLDNPIGGLMFTIEPNLIEGGITQVIVTAFPDDMRVLQLFGHLAKLALNQRNKCSNSQSCYFRPISAPSCSFRGANGYHWHHSSPSLALDVGRNSLRLVLQGALKNGRSLAIESELVKSFELCATWEELTDTFTSIMPRYEVKGSKFSLGQVVITANADTTFTHEERLEMLHRHVRGDWGDCGAEDSQTNEEALTLGNRIMSVYNHPKHTCWIITERDQSVTTILLPEEY